MVASMSGRVWQSLRQRGVTLIEAVLFISVALGLIVGGLIFYQQAVFSSKVGKLVQLTNAILSEASALGHQFRLNNNTPMNRWGTGQDDLANIFAKGGAIPPQYVHTFNSGISIITHPWREQGSTNHRIQVRVFTDNTVGTVVIRLTFIDLPRAVCPRIVGFSPDGTGLFGGGQTSVNFLRRDSESVTGWSPIAGFQSMGFSGGRLTGIGIGEAADLCAAARPEAITVSFDPRQL